MEHVNLLSHSVDVHILIILHIIYLPTVLRLAFPVANISSACSSMFSLPLLETFRKKQFEIAYFTIASDILTNRSSKYFTGITCELCLHRQSLSSPLPGCLILAPAQGAWKVVKFDVVLLARTCGKR